MVRWMVIRQIFVSYKQSSLLASFSKTGTLGYFLLFSYINSCSLDYAVAFFFELAPTFQHESMQMIPSSPYKNELKIILWMLWVVPWCIDTLGWIVWSLFIVTYAYSIHSLTSIIGTTHFILFLSLPQFPPPLFKFLAGNAAFGYG